MKHTLVNPARKETVELWEAELHEAEAHGAALPAAVARFLEALGPSAARAPQRLSFRFNSAEFVKDGAETTLTLYPLWQDAQRPAPKGFEDDIRAFRMSEDEFAPFYKAIARLDPARYAMLTDTDFEPAPPDLHHFERLTYRDNGREVVNWGYASTWLKDPALRQPLIALEQRVHAWAKAHPAAERPHAPFERLVLRDVQGREGGRSVYIGADGSVTVQIVTPAETGLHERLYEFSLAPGQLQALLTLLEKHPLARVRIPARPGIPDQARPEISLIGSGGKITTVTKWDDDRQPDFDAIYMYLLELEQAVHTRTPVREGVHDPDWRPE